ncbi:choline dehydrogenase [Pelagibacteraceae bacterium]|nr:choline dehydrogenase [Pelagibacteraceae bacterium]
MSDIFDYIIAGAGSAGCVLANRLSKDPSIKVLLIEAGGSDWHPFVRMPAGVLELMSGEGAGKNYNYGFWTEGQPHLNNRKLFTPRGKGVGGSSNINGMLYIRGHARDYDIWRQLGNEGWSYDEVMPYFKKAERNQNGESEFHGGDGELGVSNPVFSNNPLHKTFINAGIEAGYPYNEDLNGATQEGFGPAQQTIWNGKRESTGQSFIKPVLDRKNLTISKLSVTKKLLFKGNKCIGLEYIKNKTVHSVFAEREVMVCGGAINSPQLLQLSGIGRGDYIKKWGLDVIADLPGVGENLQDHLDILSHYECTQPVTDARHMMGPFGWGFIKQALILTQWGLMRSGPGNDIGLAALSFMKTEENLDLPDIQMHFIGALLKDHGKTKPDQHCFSNHVCVLRPESRGYIALKSLDPNVQPLIQPNYLSAQKDLDVMVKGVKMSREVINQKAFDQYRGTELNPGPDVQTDKEIEEFVRANAETIYHPVGTCKMGSDEFAVVDDKLRVRGVENLRVVDASVMPTLIGGNTNAPTIMIADKISDHILGKDFLPAENF